MATETSTVAVTRSADTGLKRELGLIGATWASETSIIGSGWLFGALFAAQAVGGAAVLAWAIAGVVVIVLALAHAEPSAMYPVAGGTARFAHFAFGSVAGISFGFFCFVQSVTIAPIECFAVMQYASHFWPGIYDAKTSNVSGLGFALTIVLMAVFVAVNLLAIRLFARVNNVITWWKVAVPVLAIIVLLAYRFHGGNFTAGGSFMPGGIKALFGALPAAGIIFAYSGFEQADQLAGEIKDPGLLSGPFAGLSGVIGLAWLALILRIDAFWVGLIAAFIIGLFFLLPFPSWHSLVGLITAGSVLMYAGGPLSVGALRGQVPEATRPYRMPAAAVLAPAAFIVADLLIYWSGFEVLWKLGIVLVLGYVIIGASMAFDKQRPPLDWTSAAWLPAWLIGMGIISWQGQYSGAAPADRHPLPPTNTGNIPFWWDMLAVAAFSLIIYFWAMRGKLPREQVLHYVNRQAGENESGAVGRP